MKKRTCPFKGGTIVYVNGNRWRCQSCGMVYHTKLLADDDLWRLFDARARVLIKAYKARTKSNMVTLRQSLGKIFTAALLDAKQERESAALQPRGDTRWCYTHDQPFVWSGRENCMGFGESPVKCNVQPRRY